MRARLLRATAVSVASAATACLVVVACQGVSGLTEYTKVDCLECGTEAAPVEILPPCSHTFCASFDAATVLSGWKALGQSPGAMLQLDTAQVKSPPASLLAVVPANASGSVVATLTQPFAQPLKGAHLELDMRVGPSAFGDPDAGAGSVRLATLSASDVATATGVSLAWRSEGAVVLVAIANDGGTEERAFPLQSTPAADAWVHLKLDAVFDAAGAGSVKVAIDGASVLDQSGLSIVGSGAPGTQLDLGLAARDVTPELRANYDNVTLDLD
jgi:hypothetical protein